ncbi:hypothetical protein E1B28_012481 [Marasmius oreades]|uniref:Uncharacterized protein n=1 Tax=Marasmius oreades TaxID=181124 RepID=A0A9P7RSB2_9AGAR|nr:uncharacterized protein E1B28_012481 [Marasmius oreades]KAG7088493.1 hypothetical protein E1B28_012481 [Marasmius oreades]
MMSLLHQTSVNRSPASGPSACSLSPALTLNNQGVLSISSQPSNTLETAKASDFQLKEISPRLPLPQTLARVKAHITQRSLLDHKNQDSDDRLEFVVEKGDLKKVIEILDNIPERRSIRINYEIQNLEGHINIKFAMPTKPHDASSHSWLRLLEAIWAFNFPDVQFSLVFGSTGSATYDAGSQFPSTALEIGWSESHTKLEKDIDVWLTMSPLLLSVFSLKLYKDSHPFRAVLEMWLRSKSTGEPVTRWQLELNAGLMNDDRYWEGLADQIEIYTHDILMDALDAVHATTLYAGHSSTLTTDLRIQDEISAIPGITEQRLQVPPVALKRFFDGIVPYVNSQRLGVNVSLNKRYIPPATPRAGDVY